MADTFLYQIVDTAYFHSATRILGISRWTPKATSSIMILA